MSCSAMQDQGKNMWAMSSGSSYRAFSQLWRFENPIFPRASRTSPPVRGGSESSHRTCQSSGPLLGRTGQCGQVPERRPRAAVWSSARSSHQADSPGAATVGENQDLCGQFWGVQPVQPVPTSGITALRRRSQSSTVSTMFLGLASLALCASCCRRWLRSCHLLVSKLFALG